MNNTARDVAAEKAYPSSDGYVAYHGWEDLADYRAAFIKGWEARGAATEVSDADLLRLDRLAPRICDNYRRLSRELEDFKSAIRAALCNPGSNDISRLETSATLLWSYSIRQAAAAPKEEQG